MHKLILLLLLSFGAHAQKISELPAASALAGTEVAAVVQSGATKKATATQFKTFVESGYGSGVSAWLATPSGANLATALTTALPATKGGTGLTALGTGVATALGVNVGSAGAPVLFNGAGGTPTALTLTNAAGLPLATGVTGTLPIANVAAAYGARVYRNATQSLTSGTPAMVIWDAETFDPQSLHDNSTNPTRITLTKVGKWLVTWQVLFAANATGVRATTLYVNGAFVSDRGQVPEASGSTYLHGSDVVQAAAITDYLELEAYQNSGGALNVTNGSHATYISAIFLGP